MDSGKRPVETKQDEGYKEGDIEKLFFHGFFINETYFSIIPWDLGFSDLLISKPFLKNGNGWVLL